MAAASPDPSSSHPRQDPEGPAGQAGLSLAEYEWHVWDTAKNLVHASALYVLAQVIGLTKLIPHGVFEEPVIGWWREIALFGAGFLGAWATLYSTLLRDAGLRSLTVTILVPLAFVGTALVWFAFPQVEKMSETQVLWASLVLTGPGPVAWAITMRRWSIERRRAEALLASEGAA